ncbi:MAG: AAA family ATPase, partial [bacterium]|nr:AAA family ATPase [bacterium]
METLLEPDGQNLVPVLHTLCANNQEFKTGIDDAMFAAFTEDYEGLSFPPAADGRIQLRVRWKHMKSAHGIADLSDGTIRFLMLLAILGNPEPAPVIAIDEPETGLHPSMLPIIAEFAVEASRKSQVILSTHSP